MRRLAGVWVVAAALLSAAASTVGAEDDARLGGAAREASAMVSAARVAGPKVFVPSTKILPHFQQKLFPPTGSGVCGLKSFTLEDFEIRDVDGPLETSRRTLMGAVVEMTSGECMRDFAIVQFIRGCAYHTRYELPSRTLGEKTFDIVRRLRGPRVVFSHPDFEVDRVHPDPLFASWPGESDRQALVYVPKAPLRLRSDERSLLADLKTFDEPSRRWFLKDSAVAPAQTFITDIAEGGVAVVDASGGLLSAVNSSLDFRTCVYRTADVPVAGDPAGEGVPAQQGGPLQCFGWSSRYTYDAAAGDYVTDAFAGVDPFCASAPPRVPLPE
jgi:hypothetical protein